MGAERVSEGVGEGENKVVRARGGYEPRGKEGLGGGEREREKGYKGGIVHANGGRAGMWEPVCTNDELLAKDDRLGE